MFLKIIEMYLKDWKAVCVDEWRNTSGLKIPKAPARALGAVCIK